MKALTMAAPKRRPDTVSLLQLESYDLVIVSYSGGKDSTALVLDLLERGVPREKVQLWHQCVDGGPAGEIEPGSPIQPDEGGLMDWPCTEPYVRAIGKALGIRTLFQWRHGGFERELFKEGARTLPVSFQRQDGSVATAGGLKGKVGTRRKFPQPGANLMTRWCSALLKIDVMALALTNEPSFRPVSGMKILVLTGERRQESTNRAAYAGVELHRCHTQKRLVHQWRSILDWPEEEVWAIMKRWGMVPHPAYRLGFGRVSCLSCIFADPNQWASIRKIDPLRFATIAMYEREFGCTIKQGQSVVEQAARGTPYPECGDGALVGLGLSRGPFPLEDVILPAGRSWELPAGAYRRGGGPS